MSSLTEGFDVHGVQRLLGDAVWKSVCREKQKEEVECVAVRGQCI